MVFDSSLDQDARLLSVIRRLIQETGLKYLKSYLLAFLLSAIVAGTTVAVLFIVKDVIDEVFVNKNIAALYALAGAVCVIFVARGFAMFGQAVLLTQIRNAIILELKVRLFKKLMSREPSYVLSRTTGELLTMVSNSSSAASGLLHTLSDAIARDLFTLVALLIALLIQDFTLAMTLLLGAPIVALIVTTISKRLRNLSRRQLETNAIVNNRIRAGIQGIRVVKSFNMEREINEAMRRNAEHLTKLKDKHAVISNRFAPFMEMFGGVDAAE
ncbi:MAG: ABC transporter transmembrane domain-containing protein, partial [Pseudomonadota bacterium]